MMRDPALSSLSRDHHQALAVALRLRRADVETARNARAGFLGYWHEHGESHFRVEEQILLPAFAAHGNPHHPLVARALCEHVAIRHRTRELIDQPQAPLRRLHELGAMLADHVRLEERQLFVLIERTLPARALKALAQDVKAASSG
jgi:hemerythrin-like domain-containing protein